MSYLPQEPHLDEAKTVYENILDGLKEKKTLLDRFNEVSIAMGDPDADFDKLLEEQAQLQNRIDHLNCWDIDRHVDIVMDSLRVPPPDSPVTSLSGGERRR